MEGRTVAHYRIEERLGGGGMGVVFRAIDTRLDRTVALKFLPSHLSEQEESKWRFMQEARAASALDHPNLCPIYDIGSTAEGEIYIAMPFYDGETLKQSLRHRPLPLTEALDAALQMAEGLREAHAHGIVHRDLKPANVIRTRKGQVKILDFGLAKLLGDTSMTRTGATVGTFAYMAPEQALGKPVDHRADLWALGVVLYECLTGELPFGGGDAPAMLHAIAYDDAPRPSRDGAVPRALDGIVAKCLTRDPNRRYQSATELLADLRGARVQLGLASSDEVSAVLPRVRRRRLLRVALPAAALLLVVSALVWLSRGPTANTASRQSLAVLPFTNLTGDSALDYLGAGLSTDLISRLSELPQLEVLSRAQVLAVGGPAADGVDLAQTFGVSTVVEGDIQGDPEHLRVQLRLSDGQIGAIVWSQSEVGDVDHLTGLQVQLAQAVTRAVSLPLSFANRLRLRDERTNSARAFDAYLRALAIDDGATATPELRRVAIDQLRRAVRLEPTFAEAWAALAEIRGNAFRAGGDVTVLEEALSAAERAIELNPRLPAARLAMAEVLAARGRFEEAEDHIAETLGVLPNPSRAYEMLAWNQFLQGSPERAISLQRTATDLAPDDWTVWNRLGVLLGRLSRYEEGERAFARAAELAPAGVHAPRGLLGAMLVSRGRFAEALAIFDEIPRPIRDPVLASNIATAYYFSDRPDHMRLAIEHYRTAVHLTPNDPALHRNLGDAYQATRQEALAQQEYQTAYELISRQAELNPNDVELRARMSRYAATAGQCRQAVSAADEVRAADPTLGTTHDLIAQAYALCAVPDAALDSIARAIELGESPALLAQRDEFSGLRSNAAFQRLIGAEAR
ncbi:MAG: protein kinase domain-containing protein [Thermoanaerobaculia bacterium]